MVYISGCFLFPSFHTIYFSFPPLSVLPKLKLSEHMTSPPGYLSESELISLMEKHSIGTVRCMEIRLSSLNLSH